MRAAIIKYVNKSRGREAHIRILGCSLMHYGVLLTELLREFMGDTSIRNLRIEVTMIDPDWNQHGTALSEATIGNAKHQRDHLLHFARNRAEALKERGWSIEVATYRHLPYFYGILLGDETLFRGAMVWDDDHLTGGAGLVQRYEGTKSEADRCVVDEFLAWHEALSQGNT